MKAASVWYPLWVCVISTLACVTPDSENNSASKKEKKPAAAQTPRANKAKAAQPTPDAGATESVFSRQENDSQSSDREALREEKKRFLLGLHLSQGETAYQEGRYREAVESFQRVLEIDPNHGAAQEWIRKAKTAMGQPNGDASDLLRDTQNREGARIEEAKLAAEQAQIDGDLATKQGNWELAVAKYREALLILRYHPFLASQSLDEKIINDKLQQAVTARETGALVVQSEVDRRTQEEAERKEQAQIEYREKRIQSLFEKANDSFLAERYAEAEGYLHELLAMDPHNHQARSLLEVVVSFRHDQTERNIKKQYQEQWQITFDKLTQQDVIQTDTLTFDQRRWNEVSKREPLEVAGPEPVVSQDETQIYVKLESVSFPPRFEDAPIEEVASFLQSLTGVNFLLSTAARDLDPETKKIRLDLPETNVKKLLEILSDISPFRFRVKYGVVQIVTPEEMKGGQYLAFYEVRDITKPIPNFPAPEVNLIPSGGIETPEEELPERDSFLINDSTLVDLIKNNVNPESWDADPRNTIQIQQGTLVISQTREVQEKIKKLLSGLRESTGIMVEVQSRFLTVEDNFLSDIGVDFRGLGNDASIGEAGIGTSRPFDDFGTAVPNEIGRKNDSGAFYNFGSGDGDIRARAENLYDLALGKSGVLTGSGGMAFQYTFLDDVDLEVILRAVEKSDRVQTINAPSLLVFNTERSSIRVLNKVSYIRDYDAEIAQAAVIADPIVDWINSGVFLDVTPVVSSDRRFITMELRPTVATLKRPIATLATNLATGSPVNIQLPEMEVQRVRTTVSVPDGGTILLAGSSNNENQDQQSGIPILSQIPIVKFFFSRSGEFHRNKKLLILLRAKIVIPQEHEPRLSQAQN